MRLKSHHARPHRRLWTIPAVLDISMLRSPRSAAQKPCQKSRLQSRAISRDLVQERHMSSKNVVCNLTQSRAASHKKHLCQDSGNQGFLELAPGSDNTIRNELYYVLYILYYIMYSCINTLRIISWDNTYDAGRGPYIKD